MKSCSLLFILLCAVAHLNNCDGVVFTDKIFNVLRYGATPNGKSDGAQAFSKAWNEACGTDCGWYGSFRVRCRVLIPEGTFLVGPVSFRGPCKSPMVVQVKGLVRAPINLGNFKHKEWIAFRHVSNLLVTGLGTFDGQGRAIWPHKHGNSLPPTLKFLHVINAKIRAITLVDSKFFHMVIGQSQHVTVLGVHITAPGNSPNTDGIHIAYSSDIRISKSRISSGDDCVSIGPGSSNITVSKVRCGPGHGISVGSLGKNSEDKGVNAIRVLNCTLAGTTNGVRIKTWRDSPRISATNILFSDLVMKEVSNPIIIDQEYCPNSCDEEKPASRVKIDNVRFQNIRGTSATDVAINLVCSSFVPCDHITLENINLKPLPPSPGLAPTVPLTACTNVGIAKAIGHVFPPPCF
ncbi:Exopolygalacturonase [Dendrobium catenatum]|uniref:Exopolygalacturonase n=1 Tax=Dendrobium catenatum TaxID=906689 RepID=A0A2I0WBM6_9ASPA|nr:Exopolygalacturonase [Dendrobium catenatum]